MRNLLLTSAVALLLAQPAFAQSNPVQAAVDAGIAELNEEGANITFSGSEVGAGNAVTYRDVRMAPDDGEVVIAVDFVTLTPNPDTPGEVTITLADIVNLSVQEDDDEPPVEIEMLSEGLFVTTNWLLGAAGKPMVEAAADSLKFTGGSADHPVLKALDVNAQGFALSFNFDENTRDAAANMSMDNIVADYTIAEPGGEGEIRTYAEAASQTLTFTGTRLPEDGDEDDFEAFLADGGSFELLVEGAGSTTRMTSTSPDLPISMDGTSESGRMLISMADGRFVFDQSFGALNYEITPNPAMLPFPPFSAKISGGQLEFRLPVAPSDEASDVKMVIALRDLSVSDSVWSMIDPQATIPRDPATLSIDIAGKVDLDKTVAEMPMADNPMEIGTVESIDLNEILLSGGGARIEASGAVTVDNSGFMPMPNGAVDISVDGLQSLTQKLVDLGLVQQMQVGMVMGMVMAFSKPGDGPDSFTSKIEFTETGILANGQPIQ
ncbi:DUF2125 domain-containing protein [Oceanibium sediminis]|uniref:DUF2125 domain-containing protein n=1 Tax=Oceanibium sediminis TaxID=2026339 RepID=UPI00130066A0|nr:DUF2125 domain-containing protein [Oceanibium sediminis]